MIKRRFYKHEHGDKDVPSDSSSSSSSSSSESEEEDDDVNNVVVKSRKTDQPCSSSSGYESEDGSGNEVSLDSSGLSEHDDDNSEGENVTRLPIEIHSDMINTKNTKADNDVLDCVLKSKSVFKCKLCPRILCLKEETLNAHLKSKKHARNEKLFKEGRLKIMLNNNGEIEETDGETHQERHASTLALFASTKKEKQDSKKNKGIQRERQGKNSKKEASKASDDLTPKSTKKPAKKKRKSDV